MPKTTSGTLNAGQLRMFLAQIVAEVPPGGRIPSVRELARPLGASLGAVQGGLAAIESSGAVRFERRGRLGTFVAGRSVPALWELCHRPPLVLALPLPGNLRCQGLSTGIKAVLNKAGVDAYLTFVRGSRNRLRALREARCHVAVMSGLAASMLCGENEDTHLLGPATFALERRVFYSNRPAKQDQIRRVAIDRDSADLAHLAELEFESYNVEFISSVYLQFLHFIENGDADAAIWDRDEMTERFSSHIASRPLSPGVRSLIGDIDTCAAFVTMSNDGATRELTRERLTDDKVVEIQKEVLVGSRSPEY